MKKKTVKTLQPSGLANLQTSKKGFTLAEVLITLGIIGVVAAMTIPTLITNYNDRVLETQKLKTKSILGNAFKLMMANEGVTDLSLAPIASCGTDSDCYATELKKVLKVVSDIDPTSNDSKLEYSFSNGNGEVWSQDKLYTFVLNDGTVVSVENTDGIANGNISLVVDLNGFKSPNIGAKDLCRYVLNQNISVQESCESMKNFTAKACDTGYYLEGSECKALPQGCATGEWRTHIDVPTFFCTSCLEGYHQDGFMCTEDCTPTDGKPCPPPLFG